MFNISSPSASPVRTAGNGPAMFRIGTPSVSPSRNIRQHLDMLDFEESSRSPMRRAREGLALMDELYGPVEPNLVPLSLSPRQLLIFLRSTNDRINEEEEKAEEKGEGKDGTPAVSPRMGEGLRMPAGVYHLRGLQAIKTMMAIIQHGEPI